MGDRHCNGGTLVLHTTKRALIRLAIAFGSAYGLCVCPFTANALICYVPDSSRASHLFAALVGRTSCLKRLACIPVVLRGMDKGTLRPLTLHVPYNGCEYCRSQLEAHSFSYKPIPTGKKGMRFHVVFCSSLSVSCVMCRRIEDNHKLRVTQ